MAQGIVEGMKRIHKGIRQKVRKKGDTKKMV